jgi:hypothetical protein
MKKIKYLVPIILLGFLTWYLFIKPHDYIVKFKAKTSPGSLYTGVQEWNIINQKLDSFSYKINDKKAYTLISETINTNGMSLDLVWNFKSVNDSITQVIVGITEQENSIYNRITAPFSNTIFKETVINLINGFKDGIDYQLKTKYKTKYIGVDTIPEIYYAYIESTNVNLRDKAQEMMKNNATLLAFLTKHKLKGGEHPFLVINKWDLDKSKIDFRFCFPIKQNDSMPFHDEIKFDKLSSRKALKAIYNGNYITSDRGWFLLHEYAKRHTINIENNPIEIFYDNPFYGGDELKWKAEVYLPIK